MKALKRGTAVAIVLFGGGLVAVIQPEAASTDFMSALASIDAAQLELQNGRPEAYKAYWSHADDVTLAGGFGGGIEKGWPAVSTRLDWAGSQFTNGRNEITRISAAHDGDMGYVVQTERIDFSRQTLLRQPASTG